MLNEDEAGPARKRLSVPALDALGIAELQSYIGELQDEIARATDEINRKQKHRDAVDNVFRRP